MEIRYDWQRDEIHRIYHLPLPELIFRAQVAHRAFHNPDEIQLCRLLSIKTGGCPEDCSYCYVKTRLHRARLELRDALAPGLDGWWVRGGAYRKVRAW